MNPAEVLGLNPRPIPKATNSPASAPEAADWLKHPVALVERVSLAMQLDSEPEYDPANPPAETSELVWKDGCLQLE